MEKSEMMLILCFGCANESRCDNETAHMIHCCNVVIQKHKHVRKALKKL